jgi:ferritin-like metal-binding protein YciE
MTMENRYLPRLSGHLLRGNQIRKALPDMIEKANNRKFTAAIKAHLEETEKQNDRLERAYQLLGKDPKGTACPTIDGALGMHPNWRDGH